MRWADKASRARTGAGVLFFSSRYANQGPHRAMTQPVAEVVTENLKCIKTPAPSCARSERANPGFSPR